MYQFIRTSICTSRAFVSPGSRYGIRPANMIKARACERSVTRNCRQHTQSRFWVAKFTLILNLSVIYTHMLCMCHSMASGYSTDLMINNFWFSSYAVTQSTMALGKPLSHTRASITKQYNLKIAKGRWCSGRSGVAQDMHRTLWFMPPNGSMCLRWEDVHSTYR